MTRLGKILLQLLGSALRRHAAQPGKILFIQVLSGRSRGTPGLAGGQLATALKLNLTTDVIAMELEFQHERIWPNLSQATNLIPKLAIMSRIPFEQYQSWEFQQ